jgi:DnaJ-class molecular chaperone
MKIEINIPLDLCHYCMGSGQLKAMQSAKILHSNGTVRVQDTELECPHCNGTGKR